MNFNVLHDLIIAYAGKIFLALLILLVGLLLIKKLSSFISALLLKSNKEASLNSFLTSLIKIVLQIILILTVASTLGLEITTIVALLASVAFAVGLALQGSLANFAGGVLILFLKPFKVGDYIEASGHAGTVTEIQIFYTILHTPDNKKIIIPNGKLSNDSAINYSANDTRRVDFKFGVGYGDDIRKVKSVLGKLAEEHELIFQDPAPQIVMGEHGDSAIIFFLRVWCKTENYWTIYFDLLEKVKIRFDEEGINIPYPQMDIHLPVPNQAMKHPGK